MKNFIIAFGIVELEFVVANVFMRTCAFLNKRADFGPFCVVTSLDPVHVLQADPVLVFAGR